MTDREEEEEEREGFIFQPKDGKINEEEKRLVNLGERNGSF